MSRRDLEDLLERIEDTRELVLGPGQLSPAELHDELYAVWDGARRDANAAYAGWDAARGREAYAAYRAAADREDAAAAALAHARR
ncbi:MAG: hypothetical protein QOE65_1066 [Solirubrobacteraceae bacterium]|jgi:hypothetical protein|nr:hypothetical protein [Solirubrobacteraceae bacterium]